MNFCMIENEPGIGINPQSMIEDETSLLNMGQNPRKYQLWEDSLPSFRCLMQKMTFRLRSLRTMVVAPGLARNIS